MEKDPLHLIGKEISVNNLTFRLINDSDKPYLEEILKEEQTCHLAGIKVRKTREEFEKFYQMLKSDNVCVSILLDGTFIGYFHVMIPQDVCFDVKYQICEVGFLIGKKYTGQGYGTIMLKTLSDYLLGFMDFIFADYFIENLASKRIMEKANFRYVKNYSAYFDELDQVKELALMVKTNKIL